MMEVYLYEKLMGKGIYCQNRRCLRKKFKELYIDRKLPMERIAQIFEVSTSTVFRWLHNFNIPIRRFKYKKYDFSGDLREKAYILGLVAGDISVRRHCRQIWAELTTTHPAMSDLFYSTFCNYGAPQKYLKYNKITKRYEWSIYVFLNNSFEFMLSKNLDISNKYFYHFLAGFFDSEGCVHVYNNHGYTGLSILIYNSNKELLEIIKKRLEKDRFHPKFYKFFKKGQKTTNNYIRGSDLWTIAIHTAKEVLSLMNKMPIRHKEKIDKIKVISSINNNRWEEISERINNLKASIKKEVEEYIRPKNNHNHVKYERSIII